MKKHIDTSGHILLLTRQLRIFQFVVVTLLVINLYMFIPDAVASISQKLIVSEVVLVDKNGNIRYKLYVDENHNLVESVVDASGKQRFLLNVSERGKVSLSVGSDWLTNGWKVQTDVDDTGHTSNVIVTQGAAHNKKTIISLANSERVISGVLSADKNDFAGAVSVRDITRVSTVRKGDIRFSAELAENGSGLFLMDKNRDAQFVMALRESDNKLIKVIAKTPGEALWNTVSSVMTAKGVYELVK